MNRFRYKELQAGHTEEFKVTVTEDMLEKFRDITGDINPLHNDEEYARERKYRSKVAYGMLTASFMSTLAGVYLPGEHSLIQSVEIKFAAPVYVGDIISIRGEITEKNDTYSLIYLKVTMKNAAGEKVCRGKMQIGVME